VYSPPLGHGASLVWNELTTESARRTLLHRIMQFRPTDTVSNFNPFRKHSPRTMASSTTSHLQVLLQSPLMRTSRVYKHHCGILKFPPPTPPSRYTVPDPSNFTEPYKRTVPVELRPIQVQWTMVERNILEDELNCDAKPD